VGQLSDAETATTAGAPALSIVLTGRNDDYGVDFKTRFFRTLRFNAAQLASRGIVHEFVFVEWAPPPQRPRLIDLVFKAVPEIDPSTCRWYVVDARYHEALSLNPRLEYHEFIAKNVGLRRARGRFVLTTNCDVFLGRAVLDVFARGALEPRIVYRAPRYDLKETVGERGLKETVGQQRVEWTDLEDPQSLASPPRRLKPPYMPGGTGDFLLLDRESFHQLRGFNEIYRAARFGIDRNFVVKAISSGLSIVDIGGPVYHVNHVGSYHLTANAYVGREGEAPWGNRGWHARGVSYVNPPTWGLERAPSQPVAPGHWHLDFSWDAVPPLVDLKGVVLPAARVGGPYPGRYSDKLRGGSGTVAQVK
jgi:hypothetical protein